MKDYQDISMLKRAYIQKNQELDTALSGYEDFSEKMAQAERDYLKAFSKEIFSLENDGKPTTLVKDMAKGKVADALFEWRKAEGIFHACRQNIKRLHANLDAYRSLLSTAKKEIEIR